VFNIKLFKKNKYIVYNRNIKLFNSITRPIDIHIFMYVMKVRVIVNNGLMCTITRNTWER